MNDALYIAATGMKTQNAQLQSLANNVANVNTVGFKRSAVRFADLVQTVPQSADVQTPAASVGAGVSAAQVQTLMTSGVLKSTGDAADLAIDGAGFMEVLRPDGSTAFSRGGRLEVNEDGLLALVGAGPLRQRLAVGADAQHISVSEDGQINATDAQGRQWSVGRLELTMFARPDALEPVGAGLYRASAPAGEALVQPASVNGAGLVKQGYQESSNVNLVDELVQLMMAQRAYETSVKLAQAADEFASLTNGLRK